MINPLFMYKNVLMKLVHNLCYLLTICFFAQSLGLQAQNPSANVVVHLLSGPETLNPLTSTSSSASNIQSLLYASLLDYDAKTLELVPALALEKPKLSKNAQGKTVLSYEIRPQAQWPNGQPVLASDYVFTLKALFNPLVQAAGTRPYYEFIEDIVVDASNPRKFQIISREAYLFAEQSSGTLSVLPEYLLDPQGLLRPFSLKQFHEQTEAMANNDQIKAFAEFFNAQGQADKIQTLEAAGPYRLESWQPRKEIVLVLRENWWGQKVLAPNFQAYPPKITYLIEPEPSEALRLLREQRIDVMAGIRPDNFEAMHSDPVYMEHYQMFKPEQLAYQYIGLNLKNPKLADKNLRKALALLVNREEMIQILFKGDARKVNSPINPSKRFYNKQLPDLAFDPQAAQALLAASGWQDSDQDGVLDRMVNGKKEELRLTYTYNNSNYIRQEIGLLLQEEAEAIGIKIELEGLEWEPFLKKVRDRDFELMSLAWVQSPGLDDMKQIWHTSSIEQGGANYVGFGNAQSDALIDELRQTLDETRQQELYHQIQALIAEEQAYIFLFSPLDRLVIHKRFAKPFISTLRPGYQVQQLRLEKAGN